MSSVVLLLYLVGLLSCANVYVLGFSTSSSSHHRSIYLKTSTATTIFQSTPPSSDNNVEDIRWHNPDFKKEELNEWYCKLGKSLLTVGMKGVNQSHKNSLLELIQSHERVRVKIASDKSNIMEVAQTFLSDPALEKAVVLLEVRRREFMVGRKS